MNAAPLSTVVVNDDTCRLVWAAPGRSEAPPCAETVHVKGPSSGPPPATRVGKQGRSEAQSGHKGGPAQPTWLGVVPHLTLRPMAE